MNRLKLTLLNVAAISLAALTAQASTTPDWDTVERVTTSADGFHVIRLSNNTHSCGEDRDRDFYVYNSKTEILKTLTAAMLAQREVRLLNWCSDGNPYVSGVRLR